MDTQERDILERRNSNTEYLTKCRITKPPPPKPATNPLKFVKVTPCPLFQKAHEYIKEVEEIKKERKETKAETEDWQQNLDNWKSSRRKRQEHIIERVVEVKKFEQEEKEKSRRKSKTFNEMIEERGRGRHKFIIPVYDDDNDLSDYVMGSSSSKTNSIKDVDTDDSSSLLDDKDNHPFDTVSNKNSDLCSQSEEDEAFTARNSNDIKTETNTFTGFNNKPKDKNITEQYTYEGAIQDYRSRIQSKIHVDESIFTKSSEAIAKSKELNDAQSIMPKGEIFKRKELFNKPTEVSQIAEPLPTRRLSEDFVNTRSIKDRVKSLQRQQSVENTINQSVPKNNKPDDIKISVKERLQNFNNQVDQINNLNNNSSQKPVQIKISNYILDKSNSAPNFFSKPVTNSLLSVQHTERCTTSEADLYADELNMFNKEFDNLMVDNKVNNEEDIGINYPPSTSSMELAAFSDREDSGIHTADISCSVSQADESIDADADLASRCIEKLNKDNVEQLNTELNQNNSQSENSLLQYSHEELITVVKEFLDSLIKDATENLSANLESQENRIQNTEIVYENLKLTPYTTADLLTDNLILSTDFPLQLRTLEPPKVKPPPPPRPSHDDDDLSVSDNLNSTNRIKKELHLKRSNFLGLDEPQIDTDLVSPHSDDFHTFLDKENRFEKPIYKKLHENHVGVLSKVESQDSGLDIDKGRLSSDTRCSSTLSHERQDSEITSTSEEDEIMKKEREIIELVEKEEKSRDNAELTPLNELTDVRNISKETTYEPSLGSEEFKNPYFPKHTYLDDQDSDVLKVEQELRQLEGEEMERQRDNQLFREIRQKGYLQNNRRSLENICDEVVPNVYSTEYSNHRKSMPELQHVPLEFQKSLPDVPNGHSGLLYKRKIAESKRLFRKSLPDMQLVRKAELDFQTPNENTACVDFDRQEERDLYLSKFNSPNINSKSPITLGKPLHTNDSMVFNPIATPDVHLQRPLTNHSIQVQSRSRTAPVDNRIQPKPNLEAKSYNQHWLFQEAELRRIADQQKNISSPNRNWRPRPQKHLPDSIIQSLTQRVQTRTNDRSSRRLDSNSTSTDFLQHPYINHTQIMGHALPVPNVAPSVMDESQERMLSVSGKKKCSYCGNELGRGAAMIIESLCLFYHMECFKCCVCHMQLGNGLMGTDVRVRNQKLHCHNCYSSDDGVKFSCV